MVQVIFSKEPTVMEVSELVLMRYKHFENLVKLVTNMNHKESK
jgi:hypothetical protein